MFCRNYRKRYQWIQLQKPEIVKALSNYHFASQAVYNWCSLLAHYHVYINKWRLLKTIKLRIDTLWVPWPWPWQKHHKIISVFGQVTTNFSISGIHHRHGWTLVLSRSNSRLILNPQRIVISSLSVVNHPCSSQSNCGRFGTRVYLY